ncbi:FHA domain-containing protein [Candidatus Omnitrophota bacterium]
MKRVIFVFVVSGPLKGHKYIIKSDSKILIGRSSDANIRIGYDDFCSRQHAMLYWDKETCFIEDLNSTNGTFVNSERVSTRKGLKKGDIIGLGKTELIVAESGSSDNKKGKPEDDISYDD